MPPPQLSTRRFAMARPRPEPLEVVENDGSKTRGSDSAGMPPPSSSTVTRLPPSVTWTTMRRAPALRAFSSRFTSTSFTSSLRARTGGPASPRISTPAPASLPPSAYSCTTSRRARERGRVVERDDAAVGTRAEGRELDPDLATPDLEFPLGDAVAARGEEPAHRFPHGAPRGRRRGGQEVARLRGAPSSSAARA